jgi:hypothetical protein
MRKKDWADDIAEKLCDEIAEHYDDDAYIGERLAKQLRATFYAGLEQKQKGRMKASMPNGDVCEYILTAPRSPSQGQSTEENRYLLVSELETETAMNYKYTWDGNESEKGPKGKKKVRSP